MVNGRVTVSPEKVIVVSPNAERDAPTETGTNVEETNAAVPTVVADPCGLGRDMTGADVRPVGEEPPRSAIFPSNRHCPSPRSPPTRKSRSRTPRPKQGRTSRDRTPP